MVNTSKAFDRSRNALSSKLDPLTPPTNSSTNTDFVLQPNSVPQNCFHSPVLLIPDYTLAHFTDIPNITELF